MAETGGLFGEEIRNEFQLSKDLVHLNHGSFGSVPRSVYEARLERMRELETSPDDWFSLNMMMNGTGGGCDLSMDGMSDMDGGSMMGGMGKMYFHFDACQRLLFSSWKITNSRELIGAMVAVILMAILYEGLKTLREWLIYYDLKRSKKNKKRSDSLSSEKDDRMGLLDPEKKSNRYDKMGLLDPEKKSSRVKSFSISLSMHIIQSLLHVVQVGYGYILMFIAMTFNGWLFLSVCIGAGIGYFIFGKTKHIFGVNNRDQNEHCH